MPPIGISLWFHDGNTGVRTTSKQEWAEIGPLVLEQLNTYIAWGAFGPRRALRGDSPAFIQEHAIADPQDVGLVHQAHMTPSQAGQVERRVQTWRERGFGSWLITNGQVEYFALGHEHTSVIDLNNAGQVAPTSGTLTFTRGGNSTGSFLANGSTTPGIVFGGGLALRPCYWEGNGGAEQGQRLPRPANVGMAQVPAGVGRNRHRQLRQANPGHLVAVGIDLQRELDLARLRDLQLERAVKEMLEEVKNKKKI